MHYSSVLELQGALSFWSELQVHYSYVQELQGALFFYSVAAGCAIFLYRSCRVCFSSVHELQVHYSSVQ